MRIANYVKSLLLALFALSAVNMTAANVDATAAQAKAIQFMNSQTGTRFMASSANLKLSHAEKSTVNAAYNDFYVFNYDGGGFVIVSGDDRAEEVLGYGDGTLDMNNIPDNLRWWLGQYKEQIEFLFKNPKLEVQTHSSMSKMLTATTVSPLLSSIWDQDTPFWNQCPTYSGSTCYTGCVATAMAQVMYYWKYPAELSAVESYTTYSNDISMPALSGTTLDWDNMIDDYTGNYSNAQATAVATLMLYCGQACKMDYGTYSQGGSGAYSEDQLDALKLFGYNSDATYVQRNYYDDSEWTAMMLEDLQAGRPILYGGDDGTYGHAFVVDGYNGSKYHVNWGWSGQNDGYFAISSFYIDSDYDFRQNQDMQYQLYPENIETLETYAPVMAEASNVGTTSFKATWTDETPSANVTDYTLYVSAYDPNSTALLTETFAGVTATTDQSTNISGSLDTFCDNTGWTGTYVFQAGGGGLKLGNSSNGGSLTTPSLDLSTSGGTITVKLNAKYYGSDATTLTVSCGSASETVSLTATATDYNVVLSGVTESAGQTVTIASSGSKERWYIYSVEISTGGASASLKASESGDANSRVITGITSKNYTVSDLTEGGSYKFYVVANFTDGTTKQSNTETVTLDGSTVATPELIADPETLTMTAEVNSSTTATFDILGADLTGAVTATLTDANGVYTINPTSISIADAEEGATITVTYAPTAAGSHNATITLSSEGAEDVTVTVNGTATEAAIVTVAPVMAEASNVGTTSFTATWTDETAAANVTDYTLYVNKQGATGGQLLTETFGGNNTLESDGSARIDSDLDDYCDNAGWTGSYVYQAANSGLKFGNSSNGGSLTTPALDLSNCGGTISVAFNAKNYGTDATTLTISCGDVSETVTLTSEATDYTVVLEGVTAAAEQQVTIASSGSKQRWYLYSVNIYSGTVASLKASETGDADSRVVTGITEKTYTVQNLTAGATYSFYVDANYVDGTKANSNTQQVTLETEVVTVPELIADPDTLTMTAEAGKTVTATFDILGADLTGEVTAALTDANGLYTINPTSISIADAEEGATITVTYAPTAAGSHSATITLSSEGAEDVTVTVNGTATESAIVTVAPVMLPADSASIATTSFRADWTDETAAENVESYTLYVDTKGNTPVSGSLLVETFDKINVETDGTFDRADSLDVYCDNAGWTGFAVYEGVGGSIKLGSGSKLGYVTTPALDLSATEGTITVKFNGKSFVKSTGTSDGTSVVVSCGDVSQTIALADEATDYTVVLTGVTAGAGQNVTLAANASGKRFYLYSVEIISGNTNNLARKAVAEMGDATYRIVTGITDKTYTVENLTAGETYEYFVEANYTDGTSATSNTEEVTLLTEVVVPEIITDPETLTFAANTGETKTATFDVLAANLTADVTVTLADENDVYTVEPATISIADAQEGATVTMTYAPTLPGTHAATVTLSSEGAEDVVVTINGTATMVTGALQMLEADSEYITTSSFRADWTDETAAANVTDYTLYVNIDGGETPDTENLLLEDNFSKVEAVADGQTDISASLDDYTDVAGWTGYTVYEAVGGFKLSSSKKTGYLITPALDLTASEGTVTVKFNACDWKGTTGKFDGTSVIVSCGEVSETVVLDTLAADYTVVLTGVCVDSTHITIAADSKRFYLYNVKVYSGDASTLARKVVAEQGDATYRIVTGITDKYYVVEGLTAGATYDYYVVANYVDGSNATSNTQQVTLLEETGHGYELGDVNHDGSVNINDVTVIIDSLLGTDVFCCPICADVDGDSNVTISDVTALIDILLN